MKPNIIASFILIALASSGAVAAEKVTYEKAMQSHKETYGKYAEQSITEAQSQKSWDDHAQKPQQEKPSDSTIKYSELYKGSCTLGATCTLSESINNFATIVVGANNQHGRLNTAVFPSNELIGRELNMSTNTSGDGNDLIHLKFTSSTTLKYVGAAYTGIITNVWGIHRQPSEPAECTNGQVQNEDIYCSSPQRTCETGTRQKSCNNGYWSPSSTIRNPICVSQTQQCP